MPGKRMRCGDEKNRLRSPAIIEPHSAVGGCGAEPDERQGRDLEDGPADAERAGHDERSQGVGQDAPAQDPDRRFAERPRGGHEVGLPDRQHGRAHHPGIDRDRHDRDGQHAR